MPSPCRRSHSTRAFLPRSSLRGNGFQLLRAALPYVAYGGLLSVGIGFTLQVVGQRHTPAPDAANILSSETVFAAATGVIFLGEVLSGMGLFDCAPILSGGLALELLPFWLTGRWRH